jgi:hypothetical protein
MTTSSDVPATSLSRRPVDLSKIIKPNTQTA